MNKQSETIRNPEFNKINALLIDNLMNPIENKDQSTSVNTINRSTEAPFSKEKKNDFKYHVKKSRNRIILSCFKCRSLRQKCDRMRPSCTRCTRSAYSPCEYMQDFDPSITYKEHLERLGLRDKRIEQDQEKEKISHNRNSNKTKENHDNGMLSTTNNDANSTADSTTYNSTMENGDNKSFDLDVLDTSINHFDKEQIFKENNDNKSNCFKNKKKHLRFILPTKNADDISNKEIYSNQFKKKLHSDRGRKRLFNKQDNNEVSDQVNRLLVQAAIDLRNSNKNESKSCYISVLDSTSPTTQKKLHNSDHPPSSFFDSLFKIDTTVKNKLFAKYKKQGDFLQFDVITQNTLSLEQILKRVFPPNMLNLWRVIGTEYVLKIDFSKYKRLELFVNSNTIFLQSWKNNIENVFEQLLKAIPRNFNDFEKIVNTFFTTNLHKSFTFLNEVNLKNKIKEIFKKDFNGNIEAIVLNNYKDQYYLGIIILMYRFVIDPEMYHHLVFDKVTKIVSEFYTEKYQEPLLKLQYFLLLFFKCELQYKETCTINSNIVTHLLEWAYTIDLPKLVSDASINDENNIIAENIWYWILYIEILAFLELGLSLKFKHNTFDEKTLLTNKRGRISLLKNYIFLMRKILTALENPFHDPDIDCIFGKIDEFCHNHLAPLNYYMKTECSKDIDPFDYYVLLPFMNIKVSLLSYKFMLSETPEVKESNKDKLLGTCIASRMMVYAYQHCLLKRAEKIKMKNNNKFNFDDCLKFLKTGNKLTENDLRPKWSPDYICPTFAFLSADNLYDKSVSVIKTVAVDELKIHLIENNQLKEHSLCKDSEDLESLDYLTKQLVDYSIFNTERPVFKYSPYDIILLEEIWAIKCENEYILQPMRVSFPTSFSVNFATKLKATVGLLFNRDYSIRNYDELIFLLENIRINKDQSVTIQDRNQGNKDITFCLNKNSSENNTPSLMHLNNQTAVTLTPENYNNNNGLNFQDLMTDIDTLEFSEFMKLLN